MNVVKCEMRAEVPAELYEMDAAFIENEVKRQLSKEIDRKNGHLVGRIEIDVETNELKDRYVIRAAAMVNIGPEPETPNVDKFLETAYGEQEKFLRAPFTIDKTLDKMINGENVPEPEEEIFWESVI